MSPPLPQAGKEGLRCGTIEAVHIIAFLCPLCTSVPLISVSINISISVGNGISISISVSVSVYQYQCMEYQYQYQYQCISLSAFYLLLLLAFCLNFRFFPALLMTWACPPDVVVALPITWRKPV